MNNPKSQTASGSVDRLVGHVCPYCRSPLVRESLSGPLFSCWSFGISDNQMGGPGRSTLCLEREAHNKTKQENARLQYAVKILLDASWNGPIGADHPARNMAADILQPNVEVTGDPLEAACDAGMFVV